MVMPTADRRCIGWEEWESAHCTEVHKVGNVSIA